MRLLGIPEQRITVIPLAAGAECRSITERDVLQSVRKKYQLPPCFVLFVSTMEPRKGLDTLLDAFAEVSAGSPQVKLVIVGKKGWYTEYLHGQIGRLGLDEKIIFTGHVPDEDLPGLYNAAQVLAFPSRYEGFGLPVLEAMACGTPVICSCSSSLPEVAGDAALLIPPDDVQALSSALHRVLRDEMLRRQMRERGLIQAAHFSWQQTAHKTVGVYKMVFGGKGDQGARNN
jgi:glycosyltransferase involved in cell wall biosynthesis